MNKSTTTLIKPAAPVPANIWITRLTETLTIVAAMEPDERSAAFAFLKSKFHKEWPSSDF